MKNTFYILWVTILFTSVFVYFQIDGPKLATPPIATSVKIFGLVHLRLPEAPMWLGLDEDQGLAEGSVIATNSDSTATIRMTQGQLIQVAPSSQVILTLQGSHSDGTPLLNIVSGQIRIVTEPIKQPARENFDLKKSITSISDFSKLKTLFDQLGDNKPSFSEKPQLIINAGQKWIRLEPQEPSDVAISIPATGAAEVIVLNGSVELDGIKKTGVLTEKDQNEIIQRITNVTKIISKVEPKAPEDSFPLERSWAIQTLKLSTLQNNTKQFCIESLNKNQCPPFQINLVGPKGVNFEDMKVKFWAKISFGPIKSIMPVNLLHKNNMRLVMSAQLLERLDEAKEITATPNFKKIRFEFGLSQISKGSAEAEFSNESFYIDVMSIADLPDKTYKLKLSEPKFNKKDTTGWISYKVANSNAKQSIVSTNTTQTLGLFLSHFAQSNEIEFIDETNTDEVPDTGLTVMIDSDPLLKSSSNLLENKTDISDIVSKLKGDLAYIGEFASYRSPSQFDEESKRQPTTEFVYFRNLQELVEIDSRLFYGNKNVQNLVKLSSQGLFIKEPKSLHLGRDNK